MKKDKILEVLEQLADLSGFTKQRQSIAPTNLNYGMYIGELKDNIVTILQAPYDGEKFETNYGVRGTVYCLVFVNKSRCALVDTDFHNKLLFLNKIPDNSPKDDIYRD